MKNLEEAAREYAVHMVGSDSYEQNDLEEAFKAGVEFAQRWYTDEDELPPCSYEDFLIKGIDYEGRENMPDIGYLHSSSNNIPNKEKFISLSGEIMEITHWRPININ